MSVAKLAALVLLSAVTLNGSDVAAASRNYCGFRYTRNAAEALVVPELKKNFGEGYVFFDFEDPVIYKRFGTVVVQLSATKIVDGSKLDFEDLFYVEIDPCTKVALKSYATEQYHRE